MEYEVVTMKEMTVAGISARTNNNSPEMPTIIGGLWGRFYQGGVYASIPAKKGMTAFGIYTDYEGDKNDDYTVMIATEVEPTVCDTNNKASALPEGVSLLKIVAGRYAKFTIKTTMEKSPADVGAFWGKIWSLDLDRTYKADYEEYLEPGADGSQIVYIYIGLK